jgi:hypothetical protein
VAHAGEKQGMFPPRTVRVTSFLVVSLLIASQASASTNEALCADTLCGIGLNANGNSSPRSLLSTARIAQGSTGGQEGYNAGQAMLVHMLVSQLAAWVLACCSGGAGPGAMGGHQPD